MKAINVLLALLVSAAIGLLVLEGGLRLLGRGPRTTINRPDAHTGWSKRPNHEFRRRSAEYDVRLETNALGLRDDPMDSPAKPQGAFRVLCLGDSFVLGYTVGRQDLFVDQLEGWWRAEGRQVDVVNVGTEGWSTDQQAAWLLGHGAAFEPDLVLAFPYENDIWQNGSTHYLGTPKPRFTPEGELERAHVLPRPDPRTAIGKLLRRGPRPPERVEAMGVEILADFAPLLVEPPPGMDAALAHTRGALLGLQRGAREARAELVLVPIPSHSAVSAEYASEVFGPGALRGLPRAAWSPDRPVELFLGLAEELEIRALDPRPAFREAQRAGEELYYRTDFHLNPAGNRVLATFLRKRLEELGIFSADDAARAPVELPSAAHLGEEGGFPTWPIVFAGLWAVLGLSYVRRYRDESAPLAFLKVGALLATIFAIVLGGGWLVALLPPELGRPFVWLFVAAILGFVAYKLGRRLATITELLTAFVLRGHWYLMPLVVVLLTVGSLLVVAASSPLVAPFIYVLF